MNPNIRTVTAKSTIPVGVAQAGTFTTSGTSNSKLTYSGTAAALDGILSQGRENTEQTKDNLWIHIPTSDLLVRVKSWAGVTVTVEGSAAGVSAEAWELVESELVGWSVLNQGAANGSVNGQVLEAGNSISDTDANEPSERGRYMDAVIVDGSSTSLLVMEKLG